MKAWFVNTRTYNSYGGHSTISLLSVFFLRGMADFGPAIQELSTTFHFAHPGPPRPTLEHLFETYHAERAKLPKAVYRRSRESASVDFASDLMSGSDLDRFSADRMDWFNRGAHELVRSLELLRPRFTKADNFNIAGFLGHCRARLEDLPQTETEFSELFSALKMEDERRRESLSPWEKLGLDYRDFHPQARRILNEPFFWDMADDFAPNGNDTGADVLEEYRTWLKRHSPADSLEFLKRLVDEWGVKDDPLVCAEAAVGLAFADIKLRGEIEPALRASALKALAELSECAEKQADAAIRQDWKHSILKMEGKLRDIRSS